MRALTFNFSADSQPQATNSLFPRVDLKICFLKYDTNTGSGPKGEFPVSCLQGIYEVVSDELYLMALCVFLFVCLNTRTMTGGETKK